MQQEEKTVLNQKEIVKQIGEEEIRRKEIKEESKKKIDYTEEVT